MELVGLLGRIVGVEVVFGVQMECGLGVKIYIT